MIDLAIADGTDEGRAGHVGSTVSRTPDPRRLIEVSIAMAALGSALVMATCARDADCGSLDFRIILGSLAVILAAGAATIFAVTRKERQERSGLLFGFLFPTFSALAYGALSIGWIFEQDAWVPIKNPEWIASSFVVVVIGLIGWLAGYIIGGQNPTKQLALRAGSRFLPAYDDTLPLFRSGVTALVLGLLAEAVLIVRGGFGYLERLENITSSVNLLNGLIRSVTEFAIVGIALLGLEVFRRPSLKVKVALTAGLVLEGILAAFSGGKEPFILIGLAIALSAAVSGRLRKRTVVIWGLIGVLLIFPLNAKYRVLLRPQPGVQASTAESVGLFAIAIEASITTLVTDPGGYASDALAASSDRLRLIDPVAVTLKAHESGLEPAGIRSAFTRGATKLIPRLLWPQKPIDTHALSIARDYFGTSSTVLTASSLTFFGDGYRYGKLAGVLLGLMYCGYLMRFLDLMFDHRRNRFAVAILLALIPPVVKSEMDIAALGVEIIRSLIIILPLLFLIRGVRPRTASSIDRVSNEIQ